MNKGFMVQIRHESGGTVTVAHRNGFLSVFFGFFTYS
jgi:hypothetical protein